MPLHVRRRSGSKTSHRTPLRRGASRTTPISPTSSACTPSQRQRTPGGDAGLCGGLFGAAIATSYVVKSWMASTDAMHVIVGEQTVTKAGSVSCQPHSRRLAVPRHSRTSSCGWAGSERHYRCHSRADTRSQRVAAPTIDLDPVEIVDSIARRRRWTQPKRGNPRRRSLYSRATFCRFPSISGSRSSCARPRAAAASLNRLRLPGVVTSNSHHLAAAVEA